MKRFALVTEHAAMKNPYPYVYVENDGAYRELDAEERAYLETPFHPADGNRPYIKISFYSVTPYGALGGFLERRKLPRSLTPGIAAPPKPWWRLW